MPRGEGPRPRGSRFSSFPSVDLAGAVEIDIDRQRLRDADGVGELDRAAVGEAGGDDVLGEVARGIGGGAVDLGGVLAREGAAAMRRRAAIGVDDDLAAGEAGIAVRTADDELAGRVDVPDAVAWRSMPSRAPRGYRARRSSRTSSELSSASTCWVETTICVTPTGLAVLVADGHLALGVGAELAGVALALLAGLGEQLRGSCGRSRSAPASARASRGRHSRT